MTQKKFFLMTFSFFLVMWTFSIYPANRLIETQKIDAEIEELENRKRGYEARALRHEDQASYLQFEQRSVLETRRHIEIAEENRYKAMLIQKQIDQLKEKRNKL